MTYKELIGELNNLTNTQLEQDITIMDECDDEYFPGIELIISGKDCDVLDEGSPVIVFNRKEMR